MQQSDLARFSRLQRARTQGRSCSALAYVFGLPHQGAKECARRRRQMAAASAKESRHG